MCLSSRIFAVLAGKVAKQNCDYGELKWCLMLYLLKKMESTFGVIYSVVLRGWISSLSDTL